MEQNTNLIKTLFIVISASETDEICRSHETIVQQIKVVGDVGLRVADARPVNAVCREAKRMRRRRGRGSRNTGARENSVVICEF